MLRFTRPCLGEPGVWMKPHNKRNRGTTGRRVCVIGPVPPLKGGIAQHTAQIVRALRDGGDEVDVVSWAAQYPTFLYRRSEVDPAASPLEDASFLLRWWNPLTWLRAGLRARRAEVVVLPWVVPVHAPIHAVVLLLSSASQRVIHVHNVFPHEPLPFSRSSARFVFGLADRLVVHASSLQDDLLDIGANTSTSLVPHPTNVVVDVTPLPPTPPVRLLYLGYVRDYKGLDVAIEAIAQLRSEGVDVTLTAVGEVWGESSSYTALVQRLELQPFVDLDFRYAPDEELNDLLSRHHLLMAPYRSATQSGVAALALAAGRGVVATDVGGLPDVVIEGRTGTLAEPGDPESLADAVRRAIVDLQALSEGAAATQYSWRAVADALTAPI